MSGTNGHHIRYVEVNDANLRNNHFYLTGLSDFFPRDALGASSRKKGHGRKLRLDVEGFPDPILTDLPTDSKSGRIWRLRLAPK